MKNPDAIKVLINAYLQCYPTIVVNLTQEQKQAMISAWENFFIRNHSSDQEISEVLDLARTHCSEIASTPFIAALLKARRLGAGECIQL